MKARMNHPVYVLPEALQALQALHKSTTNAGLRGSTILLVQLRASQINGCSVCVDMHAREMKQAGEADERIWGVAAWREMPYFDDRERAALALAEAATRLSDRPDAVSDEIWEEAARHYDEPALAALLLSIAAINVWNRLNAAIRQPVAIRSGAEASERMRKVAAR